MELVLGNVDHDERRGEMAREPAHALEGQGELLDAASEGHGESPLGQAIDPAVRGESVPLLELLHGEDEWTFVARGSDCARGQIAHQIEASSDRIEPFRRIARRDGTLPGGQRQPFATLSESAVEGQRQPRPAMDRQGHLDRVDLRVDVARAGEPAEQLRERQLRSDGGEVPARFVWMDASEPEIADEGEHHRGEGHVDHRQLAQAQTGRAADVHTRRSAPVVIGRKTPLARPRDQLCQCNCLR